ncbi:MAG: glucokinase [Candidatus Acidiferrales bacterium]
MILAGDIGGTKSNLGLFDVRDDALVRVAHKRYASHEHAGLHEIAQDFLRETGAKITAAAFGIAGPVLQNRVQASNLPWVVDGAEMAKFLSLPRVLLLNDLQATAYGVSVLEPGDMETISPGVPVENATRAVIAAGTGLGQSILYWDGVQYEAMPSEAGHADFAPNTNQQADLWKFLKASNEFVYQELILAGRGFQRVHEFLDPTVKHPGFDGQQIDPAMEITQLALAGTCPVCVATVNLWVEIYGSEAGNLALRAVARGGIYVAGGIAVKVLAKIKEGRFAAAMLRKSNAGGFALQDVPVHVVLDEECPLKGAAYAAWKSS